MANDHDPLGCALSYNKAIRDAVEVIETHRVRGYCCSCGAEVNSQTGHHAAVIKTLGGE